VVVGYEPYLAHVAGLLGDVRVIASGMGAEAERAASAVEAARTGAAVAVVSSGDAGVYGMASLVFEVLAGSEAVPGIAHTKAAVAADTAAADTADTAAADAEVEVEVEVEVVPGVTAALAAAAALGAPLACDFACISLSDLLTPFQVIERRLCAVAAADLALALYNPRSQTRTAPLDRALEILRDARGPGTLVGLVRNACRDGQEARITTLAGFDPTDADMLSIVIVGDSTTRLIDGRMVTPRGYQL